MINLIINNIKNNTKRMQKLDVLNVYKAREQAARYAIAEAAALKVKLTENEICHIAVAVAG